MTRRTMMVAGALSALIVAPLHAAPSAQDCRALADPTARLACYDALAAGTPAPGATPPAPAQPIPPAHAPIAAPSPAYVPPAPTRTVARDGAHGSTFDSRLVKVVPQRHGYYRLELEDGSAYLTTAVAPAPPAGVAVHVRRTFVGTTYIDTAGWDPIAVKLTKRQ